MAGAIRTLDLPDQPGPGDRHHPGGGSDGRHGGGRSLATGDSGAHHPKVARSPGNISKIAQTTELAAQIGIGAFASLFTGHANARTRWRAGLLHGDEKMIDRLHRVFSGASPWMHDRF
ncbi:sterol carrier protein domain-containing protein [Azospirillum sp. YIM B02556]|uniref:Sterol carrier protein domain-containing protein n=1 Tax=Azospirillum endophyticum TaxID=2800326 RepID=A0ABS1F307_9PROT|nr:sterol carrier protein domain-containing protein [Azospirillum endophyticum]MBK1837778.1 sterol carrier protein domain-containing protein [Azospirillum endophyticum]